MPMLIRASDQTSPPQKRATGQAFAAQTVESLDGRRVAATLSAGVVELSVEPQSADELVDHASKVLNLAKAAGRNRIQA